MKKKLRDLLTEIEKKNKIADDALESGDTETAKSALAEAKHLREKYDALVELSGSQDFFDNHSDPAPGDHKPEPKKIPSNTAMTKFINSFRDGFPKVKNTMSEGSMTDGGYTVPEEISTKVQRYRETEFSLAPYVKVVSVKKEKGELTFLKKAQHNGFAEVGEGGKIGKRSTPKFERVPYVIKKYGGYMPVTDELLADSDENIIAFMEEWLGKSKVATENELILAQMTANTAQEIDGLDGIKEVINIQLGSTYAPTSRIFTNDDGLHYLDTLKDKDGYYLLSSVTGTPFRKQLAVGATVVEVVVIPNAVLPSVNTYAEEDTEKTKPLTTQVPFIIGDTAEGVSLFDRQGLAVKSSDSAVVGADAEMLNAFEEDLTILRGLCRMDCRQIDADAVVNCYMEFEVAENS